MALTKEKLKQLFAAGEFDLPGGDWDSITGKPASFPTTWTLVSGKPTVFATNWESVSGKPTSFPPEMHNHTKAQITDFPTSMPASDVYAWAKAATPDSINLSNNNSIKLAVSGGTNLIRNSSFANNTYTGWAANQNATLTAAGGYLSVVYNQNISTPGLVTTANISASDLVVGETYTLSVKVKRNNTLNLRATVGGVSNLNLGMPAAGANVRSVTFTYAAPASGDPMLLLYEYAPTIGTGFFLYWAKLEKGTMATDWSPSPQDKLDVGANAASATKLATARTFTIGNTGKTFNGTDNVSWSLAEIGAAASSHRHIQLYAKTDNRSVATAPNDYNNYFTVAGLKQTSAVGTPMTGTYVGIIGWRQWSDSSGGPATELAFGDEGIAFRQGATTSWGGWNRLIHSGNYTSYAQKKITYGTAAPSGGVDGDIYIQY